MCFDPRTVRVCVASLLRVSVAVLLELTELAKPVEMPCLCCNTHAVAQEPLPEFVPVEELTVAEIAAEVNEWATAEARQLVMEAETAEVEAEEVEDDPDASTAAVEAAQVRGTLAPLLFGKPPEQRPDVSPRAPAAASMASHSIRKIVP